MAHPTGCQHSITPHVPPVKASGERLAVATGLHLVEGGVVASPGHEFGVTSLLDDAAAIQHQNLVGHSHCREAMADQQPCFPGDECAEVLEESVFSIGIQR